MGRVWNLDGRSSRLLCAWHTFHVIDTRTHRLYEVLLHACERSWPLRTSLKVSN